ncbi:hypothetical protein KC901_03280 [Patescibacteria group bacterium]|nr:hypothetical protein [Patescibacteria group bacterium]
MIHLPPIVDKSTLRPNRPLFEEPYAIPDLEHHADFWKEVYRFLKTVSFRSPVIRDIKNYIDQRFGYFGFRVHPVTRESQYFHAGLSLDLTRNRKIYPIYPGVLEYAGYGAVNGYYVLLSHPDIVTEDGYVFHSMYCHLKKPLIKFNSYQKMLREISLGSHPIVPVSIKTILGTAASSGLAREQHPGVYLECSFRKFGETPIVIDPFRLYYARPKHNTTQHLTNPEEIEELFCS